MNIKTLFIATALTLTAGATFAKTIDGVEESPAFKSTLTRAEVQQDLRVALTKGSFTEAGYVARAQTAAPVRKREEVRAEAIASVKHPAMANLYVGG